MTSRAPRQTLSGDARDRAAQVLARVDADGAFAAAALDVALDRGAPLDPRDRALVVELVYGVLRCAPALDDALGRHARDGVASLRRLDAFTRAVLRVGAYQLLALARVPPYAAVAAAVESIKRSRTPRLAGFANAVLRRVADTRGEAPDEGARVALAMASVPPAVRAAVADVLGAEGATRYLLAALAAVGTTTLRVHPARSSRDALVARLTDALPGATVEPGRVSPLAVRVTGGGDLARSAVVREGLAAVQEEAAQCVALMASVRPGQRVLDACAGRGGKSAVAAIGLAGRGTLHAVDLHPDKLGRLREALAHAGLDAGLDVATFAADLTRGVGALARVAPPDGYDAVIVDAPCSGLGTLARRPDLLARPRDAAAREALLATQRAVLATAAARVARGGTLVYAVCTLDRAEGDGAVEALRAERPEFVPAEGDASLPERLRPARVVLDTATDGTDGFMAWRLRRA